MKLNQSVSNQQFSAIFLGEKFQTGQEFKVN